MFPHRIDIRRTEARRLREEAAKLASERTHPDHRSNGEEEEYRKPNGKLSYIANYSKGLRHNSLGEVVPDAYRTVLRAMYSGNPSHFEITGMMGRINGVNLTNPQAGLAFDLEGPDAQAVTIPPAPRIDSPENSSEMGELYWMALLRDVNFTDYGTGAGTDAGPDNSAAAAASMTAFNVFRGPKVGGAVTATITPATPVSPPVQATLFRGIGLGVLHGPYISQFLLKPISYGTLTISQRQKTARRGVDFLTAFPDWLLVQNGEDRRSINMIPPGQPGSVFDPAPGGFFIRNLRDLATYVHFDALYEAYLNACLILMDMPARVDPGNPYVDMPLMMHVTQRTQDGFATFGGPHILTLVTEVATRALKAVWFQKWGIHRRLRPEEFGGRIHVHRNVAVNRYQGIIDEEILNSAVIARIETKFPGSTLLPQAFVEGAPTHPAYGAGHATVAGACVTILKAWFDESEIFDPNVVSDPNPFINAKLKENRTPKVPDAAGTALVDYVPPPGEPPLTVGGELNKLAANIPLGRNAAGVHWRSDYTESIRLGEEIAIRVLQEQKLTYNEDHHFSLTKFDGETITI